MLLVKQINLPLDTDFDDLIPYVSGALKLKPQLRLKMKTSF